ncbi:HDIG domain-containing metalloprotein [uncultured Mailhella sp.]|uniref:HD family phosphohydrolase n=1 Tax=uncultured Mailhella sp. TaxID=1981031 RepID=UPI00263654D0|nr:HDIG domain-containing metalloprotein [uncultured Mailhella sp.]
MIVMKKSRKNSPVSVLQLVSQTRAMLLHHHHGWGLLALALALILLSALASIQPVRPARVLYPAGEIAATDVVSDRDLMVEDPQATQRRRDRALALQPMVFDLNKKGMQSFREESLGLLNEINRTGLDADGMERVRRAFNERHLAEISANSFRQLATPQVQTYLLEKLLPWMEGMLAHGVLADMRQLSSTDNTAVVRDLDSGTEVLRTQAGGLIDLRMLQAALGRRVRSDAQLSARAKVALQEILPLMVLPTLSLNQEVTQQRNADMLAAVEPVFYKVQQGEVLVRAGTMVTHEQQIKLQALFRAAPGLVDWPVFFGCIIVGLFLLLGLFITPSGNKGTVLRTRDQVMIALLLSVFGLAAWGSMYLFTVVTSTPVAHVLAFAFPAAGGTGLAALIFAARRYCTVGLTISFFVTLIFHGDTALFFFYFMSAMTDTWLVLRAQNRQDVVWGSVPLFLWMAMTGLGAALASHVEFGHLPLLMLCLLLNAASSLFLLFALSPVLEMLMGYTTRFRMMELMNLEHPLLQELMMELPGTYHHSLVVSNLVEAGAAAIGANSLLCKVGALYHDVGKISRPEYFVENQFGGPNPHDRLSPAMSALILHAHVKHGVELASDYRLGQEISDIIEQHHGTRGAMYFYNKALQMGEKPDLQDYRYPGPKPQSREAAIVMLADSVEASSRTLEDPTPARIRAHVAKIVNGIYAEGQLDESDLTFRDLSRLTDAFVRILTGLFHQRIAYPEQGRPRRETRTKEREDEVREKAVKAVKGCATGCGKGAAKNGVKDGGKDVKEVPDATELRPEWMISPGRSGQSLTAGGGTGLSGTVFTVAPAKPAPAVQPETSPASATGANAAARSAVPPAGTEGRAASVTGTPPSSAANPTDTANPASVANPLPVTPSAAAPDIQSAECAGAQTYSLVMPGEPVPPAQPETVSSVRVPVPSSSDSAAKSASVAGRKPGQEERS